MHSTHITTHIHTLHTYTLHIHNCTHTHSTHTHNHTHIHKHTRPYIKCRKSGLQFNKIFI